MANIKVLSLTESEEWLRLLKLIPTEFSDVYYAPNYYSLYEEYGDGKALCFVYEDNDNLILYPFLKNEINSLGYNLDDTYYDIQGAYGYNGFISSTTDKCFVSQFLDEFHKYCLDNKIVAEFTRFHPLIKNYQFVDKNVIFDRNTVYIDLQKSEDEIFSSMQSDTRREIRNATRRHGLSCKQYKSVTKELKDKLFLIYQDAMDRLEADKYLRFNVKYFDTLFDDQDAVTLVCYDDTMEPVGFYVSIYSKDYFNMHLGGSKTDAMKKSPNNFMYFEIAKMAKSLGCKYMLFGGGTTSDPEDSLLRYKKHISPLLADFYIGKKVHIEDVYNNVVEQWKSRYPEHYQNNKVKLLGYRDI